jgi:hypothetical protein
MGVRSNKKVHQDSSTLPSLLPILPPFTARQEKRLSSQCLYSDAVTFQENVPLPLLFEVGY